MSAELVKQSQNVFANQWLTTCDSDLPDAAADEGLRNEFEFFESQ
jgi:hypothetical protein